MNRPSTSRRAWRACIVTAIFSAISAAAQANHGPGTSGGGSTTASGETLKAGAFEFNFCLDYTEFEKISREEAEARAAVSSEFDAIRRSLVQTVGLAYGLTDDLQIGATIGYYKGSNFIDAEAEEGEEPESATADPEGLTDLWLNVKFRIVRGAPGNLSLTGGIKLPTGNDDERLDNGELLEPSSQPGSGSVDFQAGVAYSRFLTSNITLDASGIYTIRTEHNGFEVGDRLDLGAALAYRLTDDVKQFPNFSVFGDVLVIWLEEDRSMDVSNPNSGGWTVYLSPGARIRFNERVSLTIAPAFPVLQDLNGDQVETRFKLGASMSITF